MIKYSDHVPPHEMLFRRRAWKTENPNIFVVYGRRGNPYAVRVTEKGLSCPCEGAYKYDEICFHMLRVAARLVREKRWLN